ncbi:IclR family transcriptional regulator [Sphingomonas crocodyli]|uniref:Transcriptional regulator n=1 Tax=Sphingomonas crocodyli TaxID=1979270 RepID=A0A437M6N3_9SPHN|nr:helix-turn-helix domain-containing protein [Sphingomonas crocodyli]RVT93215.1 transcriptional regulator [Sphingomonas crocodyli]
MGECTAITAQRPLGAGDRASVKSALRALDVIEYFSANTAPARTVDVSEALGIPNSSADEILRTLAKRGYLCFNRTTKRYAPSYKIVGTANAIEQGFFGGDRLRSLMTKLRDETGATVCLTTQNDCWIESVAEVRGDWQGHTQPLDFERELICYGDDGWRPATNFSGALLAWHSNGEIIELADRSREIGIGPRAPSLMKELIDRVSRIRARGFALCQRNDTVQVDSIACPLRVPNAVTPFAIGILGQHLFDNERDKAKMVSTVQAVIGGRA